MIKQMIVHGRVQGVGFRMTAKQLADTYHIEGQVQNKQDGTVEIIANGEEDNMNSFIAKIKEGPSPAARVQHVDMIDLDGPARFNGFKIIG
ncbi:acylphosphatase [Salimicrobium halophilum]|uniref:acylphosphatase n=1 Tax=Salimicrobium halophilum TaxID=86666 RepID=A0A1G8Q4B1_9BACI|nr:acylphosphatase [Salimicrobium halophilum]SDI99366.1 acylphosphatase [Salimicrobium halophilum]